VTLAAIGWVSYLVAHNHAMPELDGVAKLLGGTALVNIGHKAEEIVEKFRGSKDTPAVQS
jgi:hypothetical protein